MRWPVREWGGWSSKSADGPTVTRIGGDHPAASHRAFMLVTHAILAGHAGGGSAQAPWSGAYRVATGVAHYASDPFHTVEAWFS